MSVLRESRDSLVAMLEAFVHDPLFSWRLLGTQGRQDEEAGRRSSVSGAPPSGAQPPQATTAGGARKSMERIAVPRRVSSPVRGGENQQAEKPPSVSSGPQGQQPPPTPRLGPTNLGQRGATGGGVEATGPHGGRVAVAAPAVTVTAAPPLPQPPAAAVSDAAAAVAAAYGSNAGDGSWNAAGRGVGVVGQTGDGVRYGDAGEYGGRTGAGVAPPPVRGLRVSSLPRPLTLAGMTPLQPVPEFGGRGYEESEEESESDGLDARRQRAKTSEGQGHAGGAHQAPGVVHETNPDLGAKAEGGYALVGGSQGGGVAPGGVGGSPPDPVGMVGTVVIPAGGKARPPTPDRLEDPNMDLSERFADSNEQRSAPSEGVEDGDMSSGGEDSEPTQGDDDDLGRMPSRPDAGASHAKRPPASAAMDMRGLRSLSVSIKGAESKMADGGADAEGRNEKDDEEEEEEIMALAAAVAEAAEAVAAAAEGAVPQSGRQRSNSLLQQSSSFRPHMHLQIQALSNRHKGTYTGTFSARYEYRISYRRLRKKKTFVFWRSVLYSSAWCAIVKKTLDCLGCACFVRTMCIGS